MVLYLNQSSHRSATKYPVLGVEIIKLDSPVFNILNINMVPTFSKVKIALYIQETI